MLSDQQYRLKWNNHRFTVMNEFEILLRNDKLVDCTIGADGKYIKAHKVVLSACSQYFEELLSEHYDKHPIILLKDVSYNELKYMIDYMYCGEVNIADSDLLSFLKTAHSLKVKGLTEDYDEDKLNCKQNIVEDDDDDDEEEDNRFVDSPPDSGTSDEPPMKKPVPPSVLINSVPIEKIPCNRKPPELQKVFSSNNFNNSCNNQKNNVNTATNNNTAANESEGDCKPKDVDDNHLDNLEQSASVSSPFQSKSADAFVKKEPPNVNNDNYICVDVDVDLNNSSYNDVDSVTVNSCSLADQIIAGKNLTELTITSIGEGDSNNILRDEGSYNNSSSGLYQFQCSQCLSRFKDNHSFVQHECKKLDVYRCEFCFYKSKWKSNVKRHRVMVHKHLLKYT